MGVCGARRGLYRIVSYRMTGGAEAISLHEILNVQAVGHRHSLLPRARMATKRDLEAYLTLGEHVAREAGRRIREAHASVPTRARA